MKPSARLRRRVVQRLETSLGRLGLVRQFHRPSGPLGRVVGRVMATRSSNVLRNRWAVDQLAVGPADRVLEIGFGPASPSRRWSPG